MKFLHLILIETLFFFAKSSSVTGAKLSINNDFLKNLITTTIPLGMQVIPYYLPSNFSFSFGFWPIHTLTNVTQIKSASFQIDQSTMDFSFDEKKETFSLQIPQIKTMNLGFSYVYSNFFGKTQGEGTLSLEGLSLLIEFQLQSGKFGIHPKIYNIDLDFGTSSLTLSKGHIAKLLAYCFNKFKGWISFFLKHGDWLLNIAFSLFPFLKSAIKIPSTPLGISLGLSESPDIGSTYTEYFMITEAIDYADNISPRVSTPYDIIDVEPMNSANITIILNNYLLNTAFGAAAKAGLLSFEASSEMIENFTTFLSFTSYDLVYFLPEIYLAYGDVDLAIVCSFADVFPNAYIYQNSTIKVNGTGMCTIDSVDDFKDLVDMEIDVTAAFSIFLTGETFTFDLNPLEITTLKILDSAMTITSDVKLIQEELNNMLKYVKNAANIYFLNKSYTIPAIQYITLSNFGLSFSDGYFQAGTDIKFSLF